MNSDERCSADTSAQLREALNALFAGPAITKDTTMQKLDAKFSGVIFKIKNGQIVPDDEYVVFLVKDTAFANTLPKYREECVKLSADREQIEAVDRMIARAQAWRKANPDRCKVPDAKGEKLVG